MLFANPWYIHYGPITIQWDRHGQVPHKITLDRDTKCFYYHLQNIQRVKLFLVVCLNQSSTSKCLRVQLMEIVAIEHAHYDCQRNLCKDWFSLRCVKSVAKCDKRQSIVSKCDIMTLKLVSSNLYRFDYTHYLSPNAPCHILVSLSYDLDNNGLVGRQQDGL